MYDVLFDLEVKLANLELAEFLLGERPSSIRKLLAKVDDPPVVNRWDLERRRTVDDGEAVECQDPRV